MFAERNIVLKYLINPDEVMNDEHVITTELIQCNEKSTHAVCTYIFMMITIIIIVHNSNVVKRI